MKNLFILSVLTLTLNAQAQTAMSGFKAKALELGKAKASEAMVACKEDTAHFCENMKTVETTKSCLKENYSKLSEGCKKVINPMK